MSVSRKPRAVDETMRCAAAFPVTGSRCCSARGGRRYSEPSSGVEGRVGSRVEILAQISADEERELRALLERLKQEHRDLDAAIETLQQMPGSDQLQLARFKKRKLVLKDRISFVEDQICPDIIA